MSRSSIVCLFLLVVGCDAANNRPGNGGTDPTAGQQENQKDYPPATTPEELVENYRTAYAAGDTAAIDRMIHWQGDPAFKTKLVEIWLATNNAGDFTITEAELRPSTEDDRNQYMTLDPVTVLEYTATDKLDAMSMGTSVPIVEVDGNYFFYLATKPAEGQ